MRMKHKSWSEPYLLEHSEIVKDIKSQDDVKAILKDKVALEIGTGRGNFILGMAKKYPSILWIGIEMNVDALAICAKKIVESGLKNVVLIRQNFILISEYFLSESIDNIYLNFSDPWPKKRHHKRRLTSSMFLSEYRRILKTDGSIIQKTDNEQLFDCSLVEFELGKWQIVYSDRNYIFDEENDVMTEYERKFRELGQPIYRLIAK